jgi:metallophosphoesterase (TIGR03767 family)
VTTTQRRYLPGPAGPGGYCVLVESAGEPYRSHPESPQIRGGLTGQPVLVFAQLSDTHVMDDQSPARVELLDRFADPDQLHIDDDRVVGTYRAQELLTAHVVEASVQAVNALEVGPLTGAPIDFAIVTGDLTDNAQQNELRRFLDLLEGRPVTPDSGDPSRYEGIASCGDPRYWHPEGEAFDLPRSQYGFPGRQGVLDAARRPFQASGLRVPWYSVYGNHDNQLQGTVGVTPELNAVATGSYKLITPPPALDAGDVLYRLEAGDVSALDELLTGDAITVTPDPLRRIVSRNEHLDSHLSCDCRPSGHGYGPDNRAAGICYYAFEASDRVRAIVLDTVNPHGGWQGSLDEAQLAWLDAELTSAAGRLAVLFSHHPLETLVNDRAPAGHRRVLGGELKDLLLKHSCVVLWVNGHTHRHTVTPILRAEGEVGFWQVTTASQIDWPQQSRVIEVIESNDGVVTIATTIIDSAAPVQPSADGDDPLTLASLSREMSANDWQTRTQVVAGGAGAGAPSDRNVLLTLPPQIRLGPGPRDDAAERTADELLELVESMESLPYGGEPVSQRAHALQCATLAIGIGAADEVVAAALLHDIGYGPVIRAAAPRRSHERAAAAYLLPQLGEQVAQLVGHHVAAKRYLVAVDPTYAGSLSAASQLSLVRQGGAATAEEIRAWNRLEWWPQALLLRRCDDFAKVPGAPTLGMERFRQILVRLAGSRIAVGV